jgi:hypothetical protein
MGYHTNALFVRGATLDDLRDALPDIFFVDSEEDGDSLGFDAAAAGSLEPDCAAAEIDGWLVLWDPIGHLSRGERGEEFRGRLIRGGTALSVTMEGTTDTYGFTWIVDGKVRRDLAYEQRREVIVDEGEPLPEEANIKLPKWGRDEDWTFTLVERLTGVRRRDLEEARYFRVSF